MNLETFFQKFDQFADAPNAVAKMRELILELSASGRLVPDELERPVKEDTKLMGTIVELVMGQAPAGNQYNTEGRGTVFVKVGEFGPLYPRTEVWTTNPLKFAKKGDVLVCVVGATVGKLNLAIDCAIGRSAAAIRPSPALHTKFLYYSLIPYTLCLRRNSRGSAQGVIGKAELNAVSLWVPSLKVQERIVAKVDELMALCDRLEAQQQERETRHAALARASLARFAEAPTPANLNFLFHKSYTIQPADLRKSILTLAVQGKLVPQDANDEPAKLLFARLQNGRHYFAEKHKFRSPLSKPVDDSLIPFKIPITWRWCRLDSIFNGITDGDHLPPPKSDAGIAFLTIGNITTGKLEFEGSRFVPESYYQGLADFRRPFRGDILYTVVGATYGRPALVDTDRPFCVQRHIAILKPTKETEVGFLMTVLRSPLIYGQAAESITGTAQPTVPLGSLRNFIAPLPPLAEQRRIVAKVDQLMALVDKLEAQLAASRATASNLLSAIVAELTGATSSSQNSAQPEPGPARRGRPRKSS